MYGTNSGGFRRVERTSTKQERSCRQQARCRGREIVGKYDVPLPRGADRPRPRSGPTVWHRATLMIPRRPSECSKTGGSIRATSAYFTVHCACRWCRTRRRASGICRAERMLPHSRRDRGYALEQRVLLPRWRSARSESGRDRRTVHRRAGRWRRQFHTPGSASSLLSGVCISETDPCGQGWPDSTDGNRRDPAQLAEGPVSLPPVAPPHRALRRRCEPLSQPCNARCDHRACCWRAGRRSSFGPGTKLCDGRRGSSICPGPVALVGRRVEQARPALCAGSGQGGCCRCAGGPPRRSACRSRQQDRANRRSCGAGRNRRLRPHERAIRAFDAAANEHSRDEWDLLVANAGVAHAEIGSSTRRKLNGAGCSRSISTRCSSGRRKRRDACWLPTSAAPSSILLRSPASIFSKGVAAYAVAKADDVIYLTQGARPGSSPISGIRVNATHRAGAGS